MGNHNFCRNPDNDAMPWCYVNSDLGIYGYCALGKCTDIPPSTSKPINQIPSGFGKGDCSPNEYYCSSMAQYSNPYDYYL